MESSACAFFFSSVFPFLFLLKMFWIPALNGAPGPRGRIKLQRICYVYKGCKYLKSIHFLVNLFSFVTNKMSPSVLQDLFWSYIPPQKIRMQSTNLFKQGFKSLVLSFLQKLLVEYCEVSHKNPVFFPAAHSFFVWKIKSNTVVVTCPGWLLPHLFSLSNQMQNR